MTQIRSIRSTFIIIVSFRVDYLSLACAYSYPGGCRVLTFGEFEKIQDGHNKFENPYSLIVIPRYDRNMIELYFKMFLDTKNLVSTNMYLIKMYRKWEKRENPTWLPHNKKINLLSYLCTQIRYKHDWTVFLCSWT